MIHSSEERLAASGPEPNATSARILPFQRPPTDLQRAIQMRAQETLERERERERDRSRPAPVRWAVMCVLALVPVSIVVTGVDALVRAFHHINAVYSNMPAPTQPTQSTEPANAADASPQEPGVVMLQPFPAENEPADNGGN